MTSTRVSSANRTLPVLFRKLAALTSSVVTVALTVALIGWMIARVAEHPGVPREVGDLPPWFVAEVDSLRKAPGAERTDGLQREAAGEVAVASTTTAAPAQAARAPGSKAAGDDDFVEFAGSEIKITLKEYQLVPNKIRVRPGRLAITFVLSNEGRFSHDFRVEGPGVEAHTAKFGPGRTIRLELTLKEGEYKISCPLSNHDERGMHGTLIATAKPPGK